MVSNLSGVHLGIIKMEFPWLNLANSTNQQIQFADTLKKPALHPCVAIRMSGNHGNTADSISVASGKRSFLNTVFCNQ